MQGLPDKIFLLSLFFILVQVALSRDVQRAMFGAAKTCDRSATLGGGRAASKSAANDSCSVVGALKPGGRISTDSLDRDLNLRVGNPPARASRPTVVAA